MILLYVALLICDSTIIHLQRLSMVLTQTTDRVIAAINFGLYFTQTSASW